MNYINKITERKTIIINIFLCILYMFYSLQFSQVNENLIKILLLISYLIYPLVLISKKYKVTKIVAIGIICIFIYIFFHFDSRYLTIFLLISTLWKENLTIYLKNIFYTTVISFGISVILGFSHINGFCVCLGFIVYLLCIISLRRTKHYIFVLICINLILLFYARAGQAIICINFCLLCNLLAMKIKNNIKSRNIILGYTFIIFAFVNIYLALSMHNNGFLYINHILPNSFNLFIDNMLNSLDSLMSYRLSLSSISLNLFGFKFYGNVLNPNHPALQGQYFNVDSGYLQILQTQGLIALLIVLILLTVIVMFFLKTENYKMVIIAITISLWAINEDILVSPIGNILWLYLPQAILYLKKIYHERMCSSNENKYT